MDNEELYNIIKDSINKHIEDNPEYATSHTMYDPDKWNDKISIAVMGKNKQGYHIKKFFITVEYLR